MKEEKLLLYVSNIALISMALGLIINDFETILMSGFMYIGSAIERSNRR